MGKKVKKTRWRALALNGHHSDSDESNPSKNGFYSESPKYSSRFATYSSQSSPVRKYHHNHVYHHHHNHQNDSSNKTTRSNSTTSEHKATFNEEEYTKITTPRQDVLFKKGYLNKPKPYSTQTSTGNSTTTTCTPDHQSADGTEGTDIEYESPFIYPNAFIDQNGVYYINSFEPLPVVVCNAPFCYSAEYPAAGLRTKRYSIDSMTESMSPQNEENFDSNHTFASDVLENGSAVQTNGHHAPEKDVTEEEKKEDAINLAGVEEIKVEAQENHDQEPAATIIVSTTTTSTSSSSLSASDSEEERCEEIDQKKTNSKCDFVKDDSQQEQDPQQQNGDDAQNLLLQSILKKDVLQNHHQEKSRLKADAQEFIPRMRPAAFFPEHATIRYVNIPFPFIDANDMQQHPSQPFLPPGIPINYHHLSTAPPPHSQPPSSTGNFTTNYPVNSTSAVKNRSEYPENSPREKTPQRNAAGTKTPQQIDIAKIVSKLEEAAQQQQQSSGESSQQANVNTNGKKTPHQNHHHQKRYNPHKSYSVQKGTYYNNNSNGNKVSNHQIRNGSQITNSNSNRGKFRKSLENSTFVQQQNSATPREERSFPSAKTTSQNVPPSSPVHQQSKSFPALVETNSQTNVSNEKTIFSNGVNVYKDAALKRKNQEEKRQNSSSVNNPTLNDDKTEKPQILPPKEEGAAKKDRQKIHQHQRNRWISVSSKKKRRKGPGGSETVEEDEDVNDEASSTDNNDDLFESFDVDLLEDVVPPSGRPSTPEYMTIGKKEKDKIALEQQEQQQQEQSLMTCEESVTTKKIEEVDDPRRSEVQPLEVEVLSISQAKRKQQQQQQPKTSKVASQKSSSKSGTKKQQKPEVLTRRIMITDADFAVVSSNKTPTPPPAQVSCAKNMSTLEKACAEPIVKSTEDSQKVEDSKKVDSSKKEIEQVLETIVQVDENLSCEKRAVKKKKNKKKQHAQQENGGSLLQQQQQSTRSSSTTTINNDEAYDFLVESSLVEEFQQKTNVEVSQELDRLIHRGIYNDLEEKIKSLRTDDASFADLSDDFFKSLSLDASSSIVENSGVFSKTIRAVPPSHLMKLPTNPTFRKDMLVDLDFATVKARAAPNIKPQFSKDLSSTAKSLETLNANGLNGDVVNDDIDDGGDKDHNDDENGKGEINDGLDSVLVISNLTSSNHTIFRNREQQDESPVPNPGPGRLLGAQPEKKSEATTPYPITQAVKEWLIKTRENTPDAEVLKSPHTIYNEFCVIDRHQDDTISKTSLQSPSTTDEDLEVEDEVTVWSVSPPQESVEAGDELLDCWENDLSSVDAETGVETMPYTNNGDNLQNNAAIIEQGEEALEVYESKYGKNEDFLRIRAEIAENQRNGVNNTNRHGELPYRAICCNIM